VEAEHKLKSESYLIIPKSFKEETEAREY
jgi:hypothetical protein